MARAYRKPTYDRATILILTAKFAVDLGRCLHWGKLPAPCLWPEIDVIQLKKKTLGWSVVMSCACEIIRFLSVMFYVVWAVQLKHIRIGNGWKEDYVVMETQVHRRIYMLSPPPLHKGAGCVALGWSLDPVKWSMLRRQPCVRSITIILLKPAGYVMHQQV